MEVLPEKFLTRKDEITTDFMSLVDVHMNELLSGNDSKRWHTKDFAEKLFIHPRHLTNTIKLTIGKSPCEILEERYLVESQKMLRETNLSVAEVGYKFAFDEPTNFTKFFKGLAGITPLQYRKGALVA